MAEYEYRCVAAPRKPKPVKGARSSEDQFAGGLAEVMNQMAIEDWEYLRAESLPCEEKTGLTSRVVSYQSVLVFRRRIKANQQFFEVANDKRLEHHPVTEDATERDVAFASRTAAASAPSAPVLPDAAESAGRSSILSVLRARRNRADYDESESQRLAAE